MLDFENSSSLDKIIWLGTQLQARNSTLSQLQRYYEGRQPASLLPDELVTQLGSRMINLNINYCRKAVTALSDRLNVTGFALDGTDEPDADLWRTWKRSQMPARLSWAVNNALALGTGYLSVWNYYGKPTITVESPFQILPVFDPVTREAVAYLKQWSAFDSLNNVGRSYSVLHLPDRIETWISDSPAPAYSVAAGGWKHASTVPNPLGVLTIVPLVNANDVLDFYGTSEFADLIPAVDWLNKSCLDLAAASDSSGTPRKFLSGLTIQEDDDGNPVNPFSTEKSRVWIAENPDSKMSQFEGAALTNFVAEARFIISQIAALSALPEYEVGLTAAQPTSADGIRAANLGLTTKAQAKTTLFGPAIGRVAALTRAIETGQAPDQIDVTPIWGQIEDRALSLATDSFVKLTQAGVPLDIAARKTLNWKPEEVEALRGITNDRTNNPAA